MFAVFNTPLQVLRFSGEEAWTKRHKNHKYPFKFLRPSLVDGRWRTGIEWKVEEIIWRIPQKKVKRIYR